MCWSGEASAVLATTGFATASYLAQKGEPRDLWLPLTYFACMELLQAATYLYINQCDTPQNQLLTWLGYLHIAFQPFFVNMVALYFIPEPVKQRVAGVVYALCGVGTLAILAKMYPFSWARTCVAGYEGFCGPQVCSTSGDWHIAWQLPLNGLMSNYPDSLIPFPFGLHGFAYFAVSFFLPFLYGSLALCGFSSPHRALAGGYPDAPSQRARRRVVTAFHWPVRIGHQDTAAAPDAGRTMARIPVVHAQGLHSTRD